MFPFSSILEGVDRGLALPPSISISVFGGWNNFAYAGFRFDEDRGFYTRRKQVFTLLTNTWVHEDAKPLIDPSDYECMVDNIDLSGVGQAVWNSALAEGIWGGCEFDRNWWLFMDGAEFDPFKSGTVTGDMHIREKALPSNTVAGVFSLTASYEGQS